MTRRHAIGEAIASLASLFIFAFALGVVAGVLGLFLTGIRRLL